MNFTAEMSENETFFLETVVYQGTTFSEKNSSEEVFQISKALDGQRVATHNFESKIAIRSKTHRKEGSSPEAKQQGRKRNIAFRGTIPALRCVYYKRSFNEKVESHTKPTTTLPKFKRTT